MGSCGGRSGRHQDPGEPRRAGGEQAPGPGGCWRRCWARRGERVPEMPSKKKKYNARFPPVSTWPGRSGCSSPEARAQARLVGRAHRGVRGPGRPAPFRALPASVPPAPFLPGYPSRFPQHPFLGQRLRGPTSPLPPQARIKKIMQTDEEIGKVAAAVPVIICILSSAGWVEGRGGGRQPRVLSCGLGPHSRVLLDAPEPGRSSSSWSRC